MAAKKTPAKKSPAKKPAAKKPAAKKPASTVAKKPARATRPSLPLPPPPPPPPATRDELAAPKDIGRLIRYGERLGAARIDLRMQPVVLPVGAGGTLAIFDPLAPKTFHALDRPSGPGQFRVMLSVALVDGKPERLAAAVVHLGRPPIARWTVAHHAGQKKPRSPEQLPRVATTSGWIALIDATGGAPGALAIPPATGALAPVAIPTTDGRTALAFPTGAGELAAYWAVDGADKPIALAIDCDAITAKDWKAKPQP